MADNDILQGFQIGMQLSQQRLDNSRRMQELRSQEALRRVQERAIVEQMALKQQANELQIQYRADMTKAVTSAQMAASPTFQLPGPRGVGTIAVPNPQRMSSTDAAVNFVLPVIAKYEPNKVPQVLQNIATADARERGTDSLIKQRQSSVAVNEARVKEIEARTAQVGKGREGVDPEWVRGIEWMEQRRKQPYTDAELEEMAAIHYGREGRTGAQRAPQTEMEFITQQLPSARRAEHQELKSTYRTDQQLIEDLRLQYRELMRAQQPPAQPEMQPSTIQPAAPQFQKGQRVIQNGTTFEFDGTKWNAVK